MRFRWFTRYFGRTSGDYVILNLANPMFRQRTNIRRRNSNNVTGRKNKCSSLIVRNIGHKTCFSLQAYSYKLPFSAPYVRVTRLLNKTKNDIIRTTRCDQKKKECRRHICPTLDRRRIIRVHWTVLLAASACIRVQYIIPRKSEKRNNYTQDTHPGCRCLARRTDEPRPCM